MSATAGAGSRRIPVQPVVQRRRHLAVLGLVWSVAICPSVALAQDHPKGWPQLRFGERVSVGYVLVPVVVRSRNEHVKDLKMKNFRLLVDGRRVPIDSFEKGPDAAVNVVFLQDLSGSMEIDGKLQASRQAIDYFLQNSRPQDRYALATFTTGRVTVEVPFTDDPWVLRRAAAGWKAWGTTALHDAVSWIPELTIQGRSSKRAAVLITDGVDNASSIDAQTARERVRRAEIPVYVLGLRPGASGAGVREPAGYRYSDVLRLLSFATSGRYHRLTGADAVAEACADILEDLRYQYVLGFPTEPAGPSRFRELQVVVSGKNLNVSFRRGYEGPAPREQRPGAAK